METRRRSNSRSEGFTLVEILIVVAIIGLLCAMAVSSMRMARENSRIAIAVNDLRLLSAAVQMLAFDTGRLPGGLPADLRGDPETWDLSTGAAGLLTTDGRFPNWKGPYIKQVPRDPWGSHYFFDPDYTVGSKVVSVVGSFGPNRVGRNVYDSDDLYEIMR